MVTCAAGSYFGHQDQHRQNKNFYRDLTLLLWTKGKATEKTDCLLAGCLRQKQHRADLGWQREKTGVCVSTFFLGHVGHNFRMVNVFLNICNADERWTRGWFKGLIFLVITALLQMAF